MMKNAKIFNVKLNFLCNFDKIFNDYIHKNVFIDLGDIFDLFKIAQKCQLFNSINQNSKVNFVENNCGTNKRSQTYCRQSSEKCFSQLMGNSDKHLICNVKLNVNWDKKTYAYRAIFDDNTRKIIDFGNIFHFLKRNQKCLFNFVD